MKLNYQVKVLVTLVSVGKYLYVKKMPNEQIQLKGLLGDSFQNLIDTLHINYTYKFTNGLGSVFPNGTTTAALKMIIEEEGDMFLIPEMITYIHQNDRIGFTAVTSYESVLIGHSVKDLYKRSYKLHQFLMEIANMFSQPISCLLHLSLFIEMLVVWRMRNQWKISKLPKHLFDSLSKLIMKRTESHSKANCVYLIIVLNGFLVFFLHNFISSRVKTEQVLVDAWNIYNTPEKLLNSRIILFWIAELLSNKLFSEAKPDSVLNRLWNKLYVPPNASQPRRCLIDRTMGYKLVDALAIQHGIGSIGNEMYLILTLHYICTSFDERWFIEQDHPLMELTEVIYINKRRGPDFVKLANNLAYNMIEHGLYSKLKQLVRSLTTSTGKTHRCFIRSLAEYYGSVQYTVLIQYQNMDALVHGIFWVYVAIFFCFLFHLLIETTVLTMASQNRKNVDF